MFNHGKSHGKTHGMMEATATLLGEGTQWQGEIQVGANDLRIEGCMDGAVISEGHVLVEPTGVVKGTIHARRLTVMGRVEGVFKVEECLVISRTGWVEGEVELGTLVVDEGGTLQGTCSRRQLPAPAKAKEPLPLVPQRREDPVQLVPQRREDPFPDRHAPLASGTHGGAHEGFPNARGPERSRY
jgi:cytoskeletal protein CcmA (bactofilin family)